MGNGKNGRIVQGGGTEVILEFSFSHWDFISLTEVFVMNILHVQWIHIYTLNSNLSVGKYKWDLDVYSYYLFSTSLKYGSLVMVPKTRY